MDDPNNGDSIFSQGKGVTTIVSSFTPDPNLDFTIYGRGYYGAAKHLAKRLISKKTAYGDYDGYPIIFLFRHSFELYLKGCLIQIHTNAGLEQNQKLLDKVQDNYINHELTHLAILLQEAMSIIFPNDLSLKGRMDRVVEVAKEFDRIDHDSFAFRYPTDKKKNPSTDHHLIINIQTVYEIMREVIHILETIDFGLIDLEDNIQERLGMLFDSKQLDGEE